MKLKLMAAVASLMIAVTMVVTISYAWMTLSDNPVAEGIQITVGGGNTILVAPNIVQEVDGEVYTYPGRFTAALDFGRSTYYEYLEEIKVLSPVSTADGVNWIIPNYYTAYDEEVINGLKMPGQIKDYSEFKCDSDLENANITNGYSTAYGGYIYIDFWVVSPGTDRTLRVARGDSNGGSFVLEMPAALDDGNGSYTLSTVRGNSQASMRIGFLANESRIMDNSILEYSYSTAYNKNYSILKGVYQEPCDGMWYSSDDRFYIYEPNADSHPGGETGYIPTYPLIYTDGFVSVAEKICNNTAVQLSGSWCSESKDGMISLWEMFDVSVTGKNYSSANEATTAFYDDYLERCLNPYAIKGDFISGTSEIDSFIADGSVDLSAFELSGATEDAYIITLEKDVPQKIRMFIWIEGQDVDCKGDAYTEDLAINIQFAGS